MTPFQPRLVAFCCENSGFLAAEGASQLQLPLPGVQIIKLPCSGRVDVRYLLQGLLQGADGIVVMACPKDNCKFLLGNARAAKRVRQGQQLLQEIGFEPERVAFINIAANKGHKFADDLQVIYAKIKQLGPNPGKVKK